MSVLRGWNHVEVVAAARVVVVHVDPRVEAAAACVVLIVVVVVSFVGVVLFIVRFVVVGVVVDGSVWPSLPLLLLL